jgi:hypothetical protein
VQAIKGVMGGLNLVFVMAFVSKHSRLIIAACGQLDEDKRKALKAKFVRCERIGYSIAFILVASGILDFLEPSCTCSHASDASAKRS